MADDGGAKSRADGGSVTTSTPSYTSSSAPRDPNTNNAVASVAGTRLVWIEIERDWRSTAAGMGEGRQIRSRDNSSWWSFKKEGRTSSFEIDEQEAGAFGRELMAREGVRSQTLGLVPISLLLVFDSETCREYASERPAIGE